MHVVIMPASPTTGARIRCDATMATKGPVAHPLLSYARAAGGSEITGGGLMSRDRRRKQQAADKRRHEQPKMLAGAEDHLVTATPNVGHARRAKGREAAFGTSARWRG
jgi:hypothetical protein